MVGRRSSRFTDGSSSRNRGSIGISFTPTMNWWSLGFYWFGTTWGGCALEIDNKTIW